MVGSLVFWEATDLRFGLVQVLPYLRLDLTPISMFSIFCCPSDSLLGIEMIFWWIFRSGIFEKSPNRLVCIETQCKLLKIKYFQIFLYIVVFFLVYRNVTWILASVVSAGKMLELFCFKELWAQILWALLSVSNLLISGVFWILPDLWIDIPEQLLLWGQSTCSVPPQVGIMMRAITSNNSLKSLTQIINPCADAYPCPASWTASASSSSSASDSEGGEERSPVRSETQKTPEINGLDTD